MSKRSGKGATVAKAECITLPLLYKELKSKGIIYSVSDELYVRDDLPCPFRHCQLQKCQEARHVSRSLGRPDISSRPHYLDVPIHVDPKSNVVHDGALDTTTPSIPHIFLPSAATLGQYFNLIRESGWSNMVWCNSMLRQLDARPATPWKRIRTLLKDPTRNVVLFQDDMHADLHACARSASRIHYTASPSLASALPSPSILTSEAEVLAKLVSIPSSDPTAPLPSIKLQFPSGLNRGPYQSLLAVARWLRLHVRLSQSYSQSLQLPHTSSPQPASVVPVILVDNSLAFLLPSSPHLQALTSDSSIQVLSMVDYVARYRSPVASSLRSLLRALDQAGEPSMFPSDSSPTPSTLQSSDKDTQDDDTNSDDIPSLSIAVYDPFASDFALASPSSIASLPLTQSAMRLVRSGLLLPPPTSSDPLLTTLTTTTADSSSSLVPSTAASSSSLPSLSRGQYLFPPHLEDTALVAGVRSGVLLRGTFKQAARKTDLSSVVLSRPLPSGQRHLEVRDAIACNRALDGDVVAVLLERRGNGGRKGEGMVTESTAIGGNVLEPSRAIEVAVGDGTDGGDDDDDDDDVDNVDVTGETTRLSERQGTVEGSKDNGSGSDSSGKGGHNVISNASSSMYGDDDLCCRVVGILARRTTVVVATLLLDDNERNKVVWGLNSTGKKPRSQDDKDDEDDDDDDIDSDKGILTISSSLSRPRYYQAVPLNARLPIVRFRSGNVDRLKGKRLLLELEDWPRDSQLPQCRYLRSLGQVGDTEAEGLAVIAAHGLEYPPFPPAFTATFPRRLSAPTPPLLLPPSSSPTPPSSSLSSDHLPWWSPRSPLPPPDPNNPYLLSLPPKALINRRDLRTSHPHHILSIDPPGCVDIDDALSIREIPLTQGLGEGEVKSQESLPQSLLDKLRHERQVNGRNWSSVIEVGVHIADVAYWVESQTALDLEAKQRGTSTYLVGKRLDMLPRVLSEDVASLRGGCERLAVSVLMYVVLDKGELLPQKIRRKVGSEQGQGQGQEQRGKRKTSESGDTDSESDGLDTTFDEDEMGRMRVLYTWCGRTAIRNYYALSYDQAQEMIDNDSYTLAKSAYGGKVQDEVKMDAPRYAPYASTQRYLPSQHRLLRRQLIGLRNVGRILRRDRLRNGALELASPVIDFALGGENKRPDGFREQVHIEMHDVIAELMIQANRVVAERIYRTMPTSALLRAHGAPRVSLLSALAETCRYFGIPFDASTNARLAQSLNNAGRRLNELAISASTSSITSKGDKSAKERNQGSSNLVAQGMDPVAGFVILKTLATRAMAEAQYLSTGHVESEDELVHYGLSVPLYTHFTSPIRRYADLVVHRQLLKALGEDKTTYNNTTERLPSDVAIVQVDENEGSEEVKKEENTDSQDALNEWGDEEVSELADHLNVQHRAAKSASKASQQMFLVFYLAGLLKKKLGEDRVQTRQLQDTTTSVTTGMEKVTQGSKASAATVKETQRVIGTMGTRPYLRAEGVIDSITIVSKQVSLGIFFPLYQFSLRVIVVDNNGNLLISPFQADATSKIPSSSSSSTSSSSITNGFSISTTIDVDVDSSGSTSSLCTPIQSTSTFCLLSLSHPSSSASPLPSPSSSSSLSSVQLASSQSFTLFGRVVVDLYVSEEHLARHYYRIPPPQARLVWGLKTTGGGDADIGLTDPIPREQHHSRSSLPEDNTAGKALKVKRAEENGGEVPKALNQPGQPSSMKEITTIVKTPGDSLRKSKRVGISGVNRANRLAQGVYALDFEEEGKVLTEGVSRALSSPEQGISSLISLLPSDRLNTSLTLLSPTSLKRMERLAATSTDPETLSTLARGFSSRPLKSWVASSLHQSSFHQIKSTISTTAPTSDTSSSPSQSSSSVPAGNSPFNQPSDLSQSLTLRRPSPRAYFTGSRRYFLAAQPHATQTPPSFAPTPPFPLAALTVSRRDALVNGTGGEGDESSGDDGDGEPRSLTQSKWQIVQEGEGKGIADDFVVGKGRMHALAKGGDVGQGGARITSSSSSRRGDTYTNRGGKSFGEEKVKKSARSKGMIVDESLSTMTYSASEMRAKFVNDVAGEGSGNEEEDDWWLDGVNEYHEDNTHADVERKHGRNSTGNRSYGSGENDRGGSPVKRGQIEIASTSKRRNIVGNIDLDEALALGEDI